MPSSYLPQATCVDLRTCPFPDESPCLLEAMRIDHNHNLGQRILGKEFGHVWSGCQSSHCPRTIVRAIKWDADQVNLCTHG